MSLFGKIVRTVVNVAELPISAAKDVITCGGALRYPRGSYFVENVKKIKDEAED